jgi:hypothetical protein
MRGRSLLLVVLYAQVVSLRTAVFSAGVGSVRHSREESLTVRGQWSEDISDALYCHPIYTCFFDRIWNTGRKYMQSFTAETSWILCNWEIPVHKGVER